MKWERPAFEVSEIWTKRSREGVFFLLKDERRSREKKVKLKMQENFEQLTIKLKKSEREDNGNGKKAERIKSK